MVILSECAADLDKEDNGVWIDWLKNGKKTGGEFKIARFRNPDFVSARDKVMKTLRGAEDADIRAALIPLIAKYILKDWRGFTDKEGNEIEYTVALGIEVLSQREYRDMADFISDQSLRAENYEIDLFRESEKN